MNSDDTLTLSDDVRASVAAAEQLDFKRITSVTTEASAYGFTAISFTFLDGSSAEIRCCGCCEGLWVTND